MNKVAPVFDISVYYYDFKLYPVLNFSAERVHTRNQTNTDFLLAYLHSECAITLLFMTLDKIYEGRTYKNSYLIEK